VNETGFTLLEVLVVLTILGFLAAMMVPAVGMLDDMERERRTRARMDEIRAAILGPEGRFDDQGRPVIGGYVGDMRAWPDLWEARAEIKPSSTVSWDSAADLTAPVGQGPSYAMNPVHVFFRPSGRFEGKRWAWNLPYRKLTDDNATNRDHIGGLETENEGQPRGLWTRFVEELPFDLPGHPVPGEVLGEAWKGPYLTPPQEGRPADSDHWATDDGGYGELKPTWITAYGFETWEDGDYDPRDGDLGEHFDEKESFRLLQNDGRLTDGWDRTLRFFITADPDSPGHTLFWIVSEGPDRDATYPNKGVNAENGHSSWAVNATNTMGNAYDETDRYNQDNIVMKLSSRDWKAIFDAEDSRKALETENLLTRIRRALAGDSPLGLNTGFTGDMCAWPGLFQWEDNGTATDPSDDFWDDRNATDAYTTGQPRGLWTDRPGLADDNLNATRFGIGWRHTFIGAPHGAGADNALRDAWDREFLFFRDDADDAMLVLSRGADGLFTLGPDTNATTPSDLTAAVDVTAYNPAATANLDNRHLVVRGSEWQQGFFQLQAFTVRNAVSTTKARFLGSAQAPVDGTDILEAAITGDWAEGNATGLPAFSYSDISPTNATTGARCLVFWNDADGDGEPDGGEVGLALTIPVTASPGSGQREALAMDADTDFGPLP
jgi:prepilin-type N-terminal cleavage/methylation domain-containing protein